MRKEIGGGGMKKNKKYRILVHGCHESTIIEKELTEDELKIIRSVAAEITKTSENECMPIMEVEEMD